ncbi:hypothetical protein Tco_1030684 [Tanacetum coccineum]|uniref:NLP1-9 GAF domain-containing protein n=1 Tax=Tanacetum coccineum TaxID=301880 RepID=A0ABQ5G6X9_9ASTR
MDELHVRLNILRLTISPEACSFMLYDLDFEPLSLSLSSMPSCDLVSLTNILILCLILKASNQNERRRHELAGISKVLKTVCDILSIPLAQSWALSGYSSVVANSGNLEQSCSSFNKSCIGKRETLGKILKALLEYHCHSLSWKTLSMSHLSLLLWNKPQCCSLFGERDDTKKKEEVHTYSRNNKSAIVDCAQPKTTITANMVENLTVKATYKVNTVKFPFILSDGMVKLVELIATSTLSRLDILNERRRHELAGISKVLKTVCDILSIPLAQSWALSGYSSVVANSGNLEQSCSSFNKSCIGKVCMSTSGLPFYIRDLRMWE